MTKQAKRWYVITFYTAMIAVVQCGDTGQHGGTELSSAR